MSIILLYVRDEDKYCKIGFLRFGSFASLPIYPLIHLCPLTQSGCHGSRLSRVFWMPTSFTIFFLLLLGGLEAFPGHIDIQQYLDIPRSSPPSWASHTMSKTKPSTSFGQYPKPMARGDCWKADFLVNQSCCFPAWFSHHHYFTFLHYNPSLTQQLPLLVDTVLFNCWLWWCEDEDVYINNNLTNCWTFVDYWSTQMVLIEHQLFLTVLTVNETSLN